MSRGQPVLMRCVVVVCTAIELVACGGDSGDSITLDEVGAAQVRETCAELDVAMRNDVEAVDGVCRLHAAQVGIGSLGPAVVPESAVSACQAAFPMCPRDKVRSVCIDARLDSSCDATVADLMACAEHMREVYRAHADETCTETVGQMLGTRAPRRLPPSTICDRVFACFRPVKLLCPADDGTAMIFDADQPVVEEFQLDAGAVSCP